jgi:hypothetical protein
MLMLVIADDEDIIIIIIIKQIQSSQHAVFICPMHLDYLEQLNGASQKWQP